MAYNGIVESDDKERKAAGRGEGPGLTRSRLLEAAREVFLATGYRGATLDAIAARAGFTKGAVYWHFPNKPALFLALVAESIAATALVLDGLLSDHGHDPDAMRAAVGAFADGIDMRESLPIFGVELEVESRTDAAFRALHQNLIETHETALAQFLGRYFAAVGGEPPMPLPELATTLTSLFKGFALTRQNRPNLAVSSARTMRILLGLNA
jgi:AcrR family transcriptional regulator